MRFFPLFFLALSLQAQIISVNSYAFSSPSSLNVGLVSYWALEEASGTRFDAEPTVNVMDLTDNNTVTQTTGKVGNSAFFTLANSEFLSHADSTELSRGNFDWTFACWSKATTLAGNETIASQWSVTPSNQRSWRLWFNSATGKFTFSVSSDGTATQDLGDTNFGTPVTNVWHFHMVTHDAVNNQLRISTDDGVPNTLGYALGVFDSNGPFDIGARGTAGSDFWNGAIDECALWDRALTAGEITEFYNLGNGKTCCPINPP